MDQDQRRFNGMPRFLGGVPSRRHLLRGLAAAGVGWGLPRLPQSAAAKEQRKRKPKRKNGLCRKNGSPCTKPGKKCKKQFCLRAPFTIAARWAEPADHDTYLFVPPKNETTGPAPYIHYTCTQNNSQCEEDYPFACSSDDNDTPGAEVTTIFQLLPGTYEYWIELDDETAGAVTVVLRDGTGRIVRRWSRPGNASLKRVGWHVFDVDGRLGRVTSVDEQLSEDAASTRLPGGAHSPYTHVCPK